MYLSRKAGVAAIQRTDVVHNNGHFCATAVWRGRLSGALGGAAQYDVDSHAETSYIWQSCRSEQIFAACIHLTGGNASSAPAGSARTAAAHMERLSALFPTDDGSIQIGRPGATGGVETRPLVGPRADDWCEDDPGRPCRGAP